MEKLSPEKIRGKIENFNHRRNAMLSLYDDELKEIQSQCPHEKEVAHFCGGSEYDVECKDCGRIQD